MTLIRLLRYAPEAATGLCATCTWGTVRKGFRENEADAFCRLVGPNPRVRYAVRECSDYCDPPRPDNCQRSPSLWRRHRDPVGCGRDSVRVRGLTQEVDARSPATQRSCGAIPGKSMRRMSCETNLLRK